MPVAEESVSGAQEEADLRYPLDHAVDDPFGETGVARSDPYGYEEYANRAFVAGAEWARARDTSQATPPSYLDYPGVVSRANSAMLSIEAIIDSRHLPSAARLVMIARIMAGEPILTDPSTAAHIARREADQLRR